MSILETKKTTQENLAKLIKLIQFERNHPEQSPVSLEKAEQLLKEVLEALRKGRSE
jgi:hypothetical protein